MARISYSSTGSSSFRRLLGHNPELLQAFEVISDAISSDLTLDADLREEVRAHLAEDQGCRY
jgi:hypothetical protein